MLNIQSGESGPFKKSDLKIHGISVEKIKGLYRSEEYSPVDAYARFERETKEKYSHDEIYGKWWTISEFIDVPADFAYEYVSNIYSLEEWSFGIRDLKHIGQGTYQGQDNFTKPTEIFLRSEVFRDAKAVDHYYAWDQREELWMRHYFRFIDAKWVLNRPGTLLTWSSFKHPYYDKKSAALPAWLKDAQNKKGREWLGDYWRHFHAWHKSEADNLRYILEHRYHSKK